MTEEQFFKETGSIAYCGSFRELKTVYGLKRALLARKVRFQYIARLWLLREASIILCLTENYEKIPKGTPSKILIGIFVRFAFMRRLIERIVRKLQNSFTNNS